MSDLRTALQDAFEKHSDDSPQPIVSPQPEDVSTDKPLETNEVKADKPRDEAGKFAKVDSADLNKPVEPEPAARKAPSSWKPDAQTAWLKADKGEALTPEEVRLLALEAERRESDFHKGVSEFKTHSERARQYDQAVAPYQATLKQLGVDAPTAISKLLQADHTLRTADPATKAAYLRQLAIQYGVDLENAPQYDQQTQNMMFELQNLRQEQMLWQNRTQVQELEQVGQTLTEFGSEKPHFEAVRNDMADLLDAGQAKTLQEAYDKAVWLNPNVRQTLIENERAEASKKFEAERQAQRAKSAAVSVKGSSPSTVGSQQLKGSLRDIIAAQVYQS